MTNTIELLNDFKVELPSWGSADTGTRFGKFAQPAAASTIEEKLEDAGLVHQLTGACPAVALHVLWDFKAGVNPADISALAKKHGVQIGAINPNYFQHQEYRYGGAASPESVAREMATQHTFDSIEIARAVNSKVLSLWFPDGINYPGQDDIVERKHR
ncbi:MAG: sugar isomerase, partial [Abditibacteriaceae bacterium]